MGMTETSHSPGTCPNSTPPWLRRVTRVWDSVHRVTPFGSRVLVTTGANVFLGVLGVCTGVLAARLLGPEGRGELAAIQTWPSFLATIAMLGLPEALVYFSAREPVNAGRYTGSAMALALLSSLPFMALGYVGMPVFLSAQSPEVVAAARWYLLLVPIQALVGMSFHPLRGLNYLVSWNVLRVTPAILWLGVLISAWILTRAEPEVLAGTYLAMLAMLFFPIIYTVHRRVPGSFWPDPTKWGKLSRYGLPSALGGVPQMLNLRLDQMLIAAILPAQMLGLYVVAIAWSGAVRPLLNALGTVTFPRVAAQSDPVQRNQIFSQSCRLGVLLAVIMTVVIMAFTPWAVPLLFGSEFAEVIPAALVLVVATAISAFNYILEEGLRGFGYPAKVMWSELGGLAVLCVALLLLLEPFGLMGAGLAALLGYGVVSFLLVIQARRLVGYSFPTLLCPTHSDIRLTWTKMKAMREAVAKL